MSDTKKDTAGNTSGSGSVSDKASKSETFGAALDKAGFEPMRSGRKVVGQGKRRETLKKRSPEVRSSDDES